MPAVSHVLEGPAELCPSALLLCPPRAVGGGAELIPAVLEQLQTWCWGSGARPGSAMRSRPGTGSSGVSSFDSIPSAGLAEELGSGGCELCAGGANPALGRCQTQRQHTSVSPDPELLLQKSLCKAWLQRCSNRKNPKAGARGGGRCALRVLSGGLLSRVGDLGMSAAPHPPPRCHPWAQPPASPWVGTGDGWWHWGDPNIGRGNSPQKEALCCTPPWWKNALVGGGDGRGGGGSVPTGFLWKTPRFFCHPHAGTHRSEGPGEFQGLFWGRLHLWGGRRGCC